MSNKRIERTKASEQRTAARIVLRRRRGVRARLPYPCLVERELACAVASAQGCVGLCELLPQGLHLRVLALQIGAQARDGAFGPFEGLLEIANTLGVDLLAAERRCSSLLQILSKLVACVRGLPELILSHALEVHQPVDERLRGARVLGGALSPC